MILTKLLIVISIALFLFVEPSQKRKIIGFICSNLHLSRMLKFILIVRDKFTNVVRSLFFNIFVFSNYRQSRGLRLKRLGGQWSYDYDYSFWGKLKKGDFID